MKHTYFPSDATLEQAIIDVETEDENDTGTKRNCRLRWCRTDLKGKRREGYLATY